MRKIKIINNRSMANSGELNNSAGSQSASRGWVIFVRHLFVLLVLSLVKLKNCILSYSVIIDLCIDNPNTFLVKQMKLTVTTRLNMEPMFKWKYDTDGSHFGWSTEREVEKVELKSRGTKEPIRINSKNMLVYHYQLSKHTVRNKRIAFGGYYSISISMFIFLVNS